MTRARNGAAVAGLDARTVALNLARQAADRRRSRQEPLTRRAALAEAPWDDRFAKSGCGEREFRMAYADRLLERGIALSSSSGMRSGPSGPSGRHRSVPLQVRVSAERLERYRARAVNSGVTLTDWVVAALDGAAG